MDLTTLGIPLSWLLLIAFGFGVIIGSFLNVCIYRLHTGKSLAGHSHCMSCGVQLAWYDLFPLVSFIVLRARCRRCGCRIPSRYFWVELLTGLLFVGALLLSQSLVDTVFYWLMFAVLVVIVMYDIDHQIIPDALTTALLVFIVLHLAYELTQGMTLESLGFDLLAAAAGSGFLLFLWIISSGRWLGFGDVKLAFPLGLLVGAQLAFSFMVLSFWIGAAISLGLLGIEKLKRGKTDLHLTAPGLTMKSAVPFAPFLIAGSLTALFLQLNVLTFFQL